MADNFETRIPGNVSIWKVNPLNTDSQANSDLFKDLKDLNNLPEITSVEDLLAYIQENLIRFDTTPKNYKKDDYKSLLKTINRSLFYIYRRDAEINYILNGVYFIGSADINTNPLTDKDLYGYKNNGIYIASESGYYEYFNITVTPDDIKTGIVYLVPIYTTEITSNYEKHIINIPKVGELSPIFWDDDNDTFSFPVPDGGSIQIGQELFDYYTNVDTVPLTEGMPVSIVTVPGSRKAIRRTDPTSKTSVESFVGIVTVPFIAINQQGRVTKFGNVSQFNTSSWADNDPLYVTSFGVIGNTEPAAGIYKVKVGHVVVSSNNGTIGVNSFVRPKLVELSDVDGATTDIVDAETIPVKKADGIIKFLSWANIKATLKTYFDTLYEKLANKQNSLAVDGTGVKYPTVDLLVENISFPFYNAGFGHTDTANQLKMLSAIKSMILIGNWDRSKNYAIRSLYRNHSTYKYMITIYELNELGVVVGSTYYTSGEIEVTEAGVGKNTKVVCPIDANGRSLELTINYNDLTINTTDYNFATSPYNWLIKKINYDKTNIYDSDLTNLKISPAFVDAGFGFTNTTDQILVHQAIKDFRLIGEWDKTKNYAIRNIYKNDGTNKYRLSINEIAADGSVVGIIYDSGVVDVTEAGTGKYTRVLYPTVSSRSVELLIDYNRLTTSLYSFYLGSLNFVVRKDKIDRTALNGDLINELIRTTAFYNAKFGIAETDARLLTTSAIKSIRLIGDWSVDGNYRISVLYKNNSTHKYKLEISKVDNNGNTIASQGYNSGIYVITEAGLGKNTHVVFPMVDNKSVEMVVDYNILSSSYNEGSRNYVIRRENIQNIQNTALTPVNGALQTFDYAGYLATCTTPGSQVLRRRNNAALLNVINKRGGFYYRCDDNGADLVFESIFEKYGYAITYSINAALSEATRFVDVQRRGHLVCDHTPDHSCNYFTIPTGADALFTSLIGSGIASITNGKATLQITVLDGVTDVTNPVTPAIDLVNLKIGADGGYNLISGTNRIEGDFSAFTANPYFYVYVDNATGDKIGWVPAIASSVLAGSCTVTKQDGTAILFGANESINMYAQHTGSDKITLSEDAAYCLMLAGIEWFRVLGLQKPYAFCQPGGTTPRMNAIAATGAIERLGLDAAFFSDTAVETVLTYNHTRNYPKLSYYPNTTLYIDYMTLADLQGVKELLSYYAATRKIVAVMSHHYLAKLYFEGATEAARIENYRKFIYDLMTWAYEQNIPVLSHCETVQLLNNSTTNRSENIMPDLYTDRAGQGKPDGYALGAGVVWLNNDGTHEDKIHSLKLTGNGELFTITDLGGLEKGNNEFEIWIKGTTGGIVSVQFGTFGTAVFTLGVTAAWQKFKLADSTGITSLDIPYTTNFLTITATASNNVGTDISVSGMKLKGI